MPVISLMAWDSRHLRFHFGLFAFERVWRPRMMKENELLFELVYVPIATIVIDWILKADDAILN